MSCERCAKKTWKCVSTARRDLLCQFLWPHWKIASVCVFLWEKADSKPTFPEQSQPKLSDRCGIPWLVAKHLPKVSNWSNCKGGYMVRQKLKHDTSSCCQTFLSLSSIQLIYVALPKIFLKFFHLSLNIWMSESFSWERGMEKCEKLDHWWAPSWWNLILAPHWKHLQKVDWVLF